MSMDERDTLNLQYNNVITNVPATAGASAQGNAGGLSAEERRQRYYGASGPGAPRSCGSPARVIDFEEWLTLLGTAGTDDVIQAARKWQNAESMPTCNLQIQVMDISNCTLVLESAAVAEGQWSQIAAYLRPGMPGW